jgi:hypothetical protein
MKGTKQPLVVNGKPMKSECASWSAPIHTVWSETAVVDAVPSKAETALENVALVKENIVLIERGISTWVEKAERASAAGAVAAIIVNYYDEFTPMVGVDGFVSDIPVLMIKFSDAERLRGQRSARMQSVKECRIDLADNPKGFTLPPNIGELVDEITELSLKGCSITGARAVRLYHGTPGLLADDLSPAQRQRTRCIRSVCSCRTRWFTSDCIREWTTRRREEGTTMQNIWRKSAHACAGKRSRGKNTRCYRR